MHSDNDAKRISDVDVIKIALTGDSLLTMKLSIHSDPRLLKLIKLIRAADAAYTNLEVLFHDYEPAPASESGGTYVRADPALVNDLVWAGFNLIGRANNHAGDYGVEGMRLTTKYVRQAGLVEAGVGNSLREAREARFLDTDHARFALVSTASTFTGQSRANDTWGDTKPRPGLSPLRIRVTETLTRGEFDNLRRALIAAGQLANEEAGNSSPDSMVYGRHFTVGEKRGRRSDLLKCDLDAINSVVSNASRQADYTIIACHSHEIGEESDSPPDFLVSFAHATIDAGADVFAASGPHSLRGIEIYKGRPIFYSLGNFIFENETLLRQPPENYQELDMTRESGVSDFNDRRTNGGKTGFPSEESSWESVVAVPSFKGKLLRGIKLHPISLGFGRQRSQRGWPRLATAAAARKIIGDLAHMSVRFGTTIRFRKGIGEVIF
jgi:poly-gamma-glutamate synthesis protein (capsule biosynthesis protein)